MLWSGLIVMLSTSRPELELSFSSELGADVGPKIVLLVVPG